MATTQPGGRITKAAGADLSTKQYFIVKLVANAVVLSSAATNQHLGTLENNPVSGDTAVVLGRHSSDTGKVILGGTVAAGDKLTSDANGKAVATTTANDVVMGIAQNAGVLNDIVEYTPVYDTVSAG